MKQLLIFHASGDLVRILHEVQQAQEYCIVGVVSMQAKPPSGVPHFAELGELATEGLAFCSFFVVGDERLLNQHRLSAYLDAKRHGRPVIALRAASASIAADVRLRENVFIDHAARVMPGANIGANTWIMQGSEVESACKIGSSCWIGSRCRVSAGAVLGKNCTLGDGVSIGPGVVLPAWSTIGAGVAITESPATTLFIDSRFKSPVYLFS